MKKSVFVMLLISSNLWAQEPQKIVVQVSNVNSTKGVVRCGLFAKSDGFPSDANRAIQRTSAPAAAGKVVCEFSGVQPGKYAVSVVHDENNNDKIDTNFVGIPSEGYGASNNNLPALSPPNFGDSSFDYSSGTKTISVQLKY
ncbi:MAG: DUF2141 domain-containing protein [bacterium]